MRKEKLTILLLLVLLMSACTNSPETTFNEYGISFTCPTGWKIDEAYEREGFCNIQIKKGGWRNEALCIIQAFSDEIDTELYTKTFFETFENNRFISNLKYEEEEYDTYGFYQGTSIKFTNTTFMLPLQGKLMFFKTNNRSICVLIYGPKTSKAKNNRGFKIIEESLNIAPFDSNIFEI